jgi:hypothetical protein
MFGLANPPIPFINIGAVFLVFAGLVISDVMGIGRG